MGSAKVATVPSQPMHKDEVGKSNRASTRKRKATSYNEETEDDVQIVAVKPRKKPKKATVDLTIDHQEDAHNTPLPLKKQRKSRKSKVKSVEGLTEITANESSSKGKGKEADGGLASAGETAVDDGPPSKKDKPAADEEKRLRRFRAKPPQGYEMIKQRALTQRMFLIDRRRGGTDECPTETVKMVGSTGNVYTVKIGRMPSCNCPHANKGHQCKHIVYVMNRVLHAPAHLEYQLALLRSELREIFTHAPPIPTANASESSSNRKPIEGDCPICCTDFEPGKEEIVYCKAACGNNIHKECFQQWARSKGGGAVTCPFCRTPWQGEDLSIKSIAETGEVNEEGYVNVGDQLGLSGARDYSTYHPFWVRRQAWY